MKTVVGAWLPRTPSTTSRLSIDKGLALAGIEPPKRVAGPIPVTRETIGATATGGIGIAQIADVLPQVSDVINQTNGDLTSGSAVRMGIGVMLMTIAILIAWAQVRRHQASGMPLSGCDDSRRSHLACDRAAGYARRRRNGPGARGGGIRCGC